MKQQIVYVVLNGEKHMGGGIVSIHKSLDTAVEAAKKVYCCFEGGWVPDGMLTWENGCDFVCVVECEVKP